MTIADQDLAVIDAIVQPFRAGRMDLAVPAAVRAVEAAPGHILTHFYVTHLIAQAPFELGLALERQYCRLMDCADLAEVLDRLEGHFASADAANRYETFNSLARLFLLRERPDLMVRAFGHCLRPATRAPAARQQVSGEYRDSAERYDDDHSHRLNAETFVSLLDECLEPPRHDLVVVDLACGSGLCATAARPLAAHLTGIDLSAAMLARARGTNLYDHLIEGDMVTSLDKLERPADLILCSGATYYLDDLAPFLAAASRALRPGGRLFFSDHPARDGDPVMETIAGTPRYCRSAALVLDLARRHGLAPLHQVPGLAFTVPVYYWMLARA